MPTLASKSRTRTRCTHLGHVPSHLAAMPQSLGREWYPSHVRMYSACSMHLARHLEFFSLTGEPCNRSPVSSALTVHYPVSMATQAESVCVCVPQVGHMWAMIGPLAPLFAAIDAAFISSPSFSHFLSFLPSFFLSCTRYRPLISTRPPPPVDGRHNTPVHLFTSNCRCAKWPSTIDNASNNNLITFKIEAAS